MWVNYKKFLGRGWALSMTEPHFSAGTSYFWSIPSQIHLRSNIFWPFKHKMPYFTFTEIFLGEYAIYSRLGKANLVHSYVGTNSKLLLS